LRYEDFNQYFKGDNFAFQGFTNLPELSWGVAPGYYTARLRRLIKG
jgi:hypothetical protein